MKLTAATRLLASTDADVATLAQPFIEVFGEPNQKLKSADSIALGWNKGLFRISIKTVNEKDILKLAFSCDGFTFSDDGASAQYLCWKFGNELYKFKFNLMKKAFKSGKPDPLQDDLAKLYPLITEVARSK